MTKSIVFGGNGFMGSHLVDQLVKQGHEVTCFDRFSEGTKKYTAKNVIQYIGDIMNTADVSKALTGQEYVFHFISTTTPVTAENDPTLDIKTNIASSVELLNRCVKHNIKKVFFASTGGAIYGDQNTPLINEQSPTLPFSPYAIGKLTIENYLRYFKKKFGLDYVVLRISNPYGTRQGLNKKQGVIPIFLRHLIEHEPITVYGNGSMVRDYIYIEDAVKMIAQIADTNNQHTVYNIGAGAGYSVNQLVDCIAKVTEQSPIINHIETPVTFVEKAVLDTSRFNAEFGVQPTTKLEEGIKHTWIELMKQYEEQQ